jgi:glycosyltransferase involved in cell wall biosynthesis
MKILCVIPSYFPAFQFGGPIYSVHGLNKILAKKGIDVTVYTTNVGLDNRVPVDKEVVVDGVKIIYFRYTRFFEFLGTSGWQFCFPMTRALKKNVKTFDIVYIVAIWNFPATVAAHYCREYKKPYIISPRGLLYPSTAGKKIWKKLPYYYLAAKRDLTCASAIHYTTEDEERKCHLPLGFKNRAVIIANGIDLSDFNDLGGRKRLRDSFHLKNKNVILFLGRINWKKGLDILVKAYALLAQRRDDVHLLIVGDDQRSYAEKVRRWIGDYGIPDRVTFTGMLTGREKLEAYAGSDLFTLPSYSENFGMAVLEAMACRLPVVISDQVGVSKEVSEAKAGLIVDTDAKQLAEGMEHLLDNPHIRKKMGENGRQLVEEKFLLDTVAKKMINVYAEIINRQL